MSIDILRENYYKAKAFVDISRDPEGTLNKPIRDNCSGEMTIRNYIDLTRRDPEDEVSMSLAFSTREMYEMDKSYDEVLTPKERRQNHGYTRSPFLNSRQNREDS